MGIFDKLFGKKNVTNSTSLVTKTDAAVSHFDPMLHVHPDIQDLLWIADGPRKNYTPKEDEDVFESNGIRIVYSPFSIQEPSLISMKLPVKIDANPAQVDRPPYFPSYSQLTAAQRGVYWKFLSDPYNHQFDIGYVFILYYGLERHLLGGDYEKAFDVILKLRDVYENASFQSYSACALILTALIRQQPELAVKFYQSLDKKYEFNFSSDLYIFCKMGLNQPLTAEDIMRMSKSFEFSNQNYIKKYPDLFLEELQSLMQSSFGCEELDINRFITRTEWNKLRKQAIPIFANVSIRDQSVEIPLIIECFKFKKAVYDLLESAHANVKQRLAEMRKNSTAPKEKKATVEKSAPSLSFDAAQEKELLKEYRKSCLNAVRRHFALIYLQNFYYKYRDLSEEYLNKCISYCKEDISKLPELQYAHMVQEKEALQKIAKFYTKKELEAKTKALGPFTADIPAFKRLAIIYQKQKDYSLAIEICNQAISYYSEVGRNDHVLDFQDRLKKLEAKTAKDSQ